MPTPNLIWHTDVPEPSAVVLVLHGGREHSTRAVHRWQAAVWWMLPFATAVRAAGNGSVAVAVLRYAVRGWNGPEASPLADANLALEQVAARHPNVPVGLLGHSMGGRVALRLAGDERIRAIAALAPWVDPADAPRWHRGLHVLMMHGTRDRVTSPVRSRAYAAELSSLGADVTYVPVVGDTHAMVRQARRWHQESAAYLVQNLVPPQPAPR